MNAAAVTRLREVWDVGVKLLHASAAAADQAASEPRISLDMAASSTAGTFSDDAKGQHHIAREIKWTAEAIEAAKPWPALRLEPLGGMEPEEQRILKDMHALNDRHAISLQCLAVRLHRISRVLNALAAVPAKRSKGGRKPGSGEFTDDDRWLTAMAALSGDITANGRATVIVERERAEATKTGRPMAIKGASDESTIRRLGDKYRKKLK